MRAPPLLPMCLAFECRVAMIPEMISDLDIFRSAQVLIREHGEGAAIEDSQHADAMLEKGDLEGQAVWKRIIEAEEEIQRMERRSEEAAH